MPKLYHFYFIGGLQQPQYYEALVYKIGCTIKLQKCKGYFFYYSLKSLKNGLI